jgi:AraC-like DNA-binding protein
VSNGLTRRPGWLDEAQRLVDDGFRRPVSVRELARRLGVHSDHLSTRFCEANGVTIRRYLRLRRVAWSLREVDQSRSSLAEIAVAAGFFDQSHMTRSFRAMLGIGPGGFRRLVRRRAWEIEASRSNPQGSKEPHGELIVIAQAEAILASGSEGRDTRKDGRGAADSPLRRMALAVTSINIVESARWARQTPIRHRTVAIVPARDTTQTSYQSDLELGILEFLDLGRYFARWVWH